MALGPEIGDVYLEVHASTRGLSQEIRRAARLAATDFAGEFGDGLDDEMGPRLSLMGRRIQTVLAQEGKLSGKGFSDALFDSVQRRMDRFDATIADAITGGDWSQVLDDFDDLDEGLDKINRRLVTLHDNNELTDESFERIQASLGAYVVRTKDAIATEKDHSARLAGLKEDIDRQVTAHHELGDEMDRVVDLAYQMNDDYDSNRRHVLLDEHNRILDLISDHEQWSLELDRKIDKDHALAIEENKQVDRWNKMPRLISLVARRISRSNVDIDRHTGFWRNLVTQLRDYNDHYSALGRLVNSRSEFLHVVGVIGGTAERAMGRLVDRILEFPDAIRRFSNSIDENGGGIQGFFATLGQNVAGMAVNWKALLIQVVAVVGTIGASFGILAPVVGMVAAAISGLLGIVTALVASLAYGLVGAVAPLGPILLALAAGVAAVVIAFQDLDDEQKKMFDPFKDWLKTVKDHVQQAILPKLSGQIQGVVDALGPLADTTLTGAAQALSGVIDYLVEAFSRPEVQENMKTLSDALPGILTDLGGALVDLTTGFSGFLTALAPYAQTMADNLGVIAKNFSDWANSKEGQEALKTFFDQASTAADTLWGLVVNVSTALGTLFSQTNDDGTTMIDQLSSIIAKFAEWASTDEGRQQISDWMEYAKQLAGDLGHLIGQASDLIATLDKPENRQALEDVINGLTTTVLVVEDLQDKLGWLSPIFSAVFGGMVSLLVIVGQNVQDIIDGVRTLIGWVETGISKLSGLRGTWDKFVASHGGDFINWVRSQFASGGTVLGPTRALIGEAGPEAVVPLNRPLSQVDPSVRWLSAIAQGLTPLASGGVAGGGKSIYVAPGAIVVTPPYADPEQAASAVLDKFVAQAR